MKKETYKLLLKKIEEKDSANKNELKAMKGIFEESINLFLYILLDKKFSEEILGYNIFLYTQFYLYSYTLLAMHLELSLEEYLSDLILSENYKYKEMIKNRLILNGLL